MHKQTDPNFVPCFFLRSSFSFFLIKRERIEEWQEKVYVRKGTERTRESTPINVNHDLTYTVIFVILQVADLPRVETDPRDHFKTSCNDAAGKMRWSLVFI